MARYRFGEGEYRYFRQPYPRPIEALKQALYPRLLPIARDWWAKLGRDAPWPDTLDEWLDMCHAAGQPKSTAILLKYGAGGWNALHRDLYGELVFPLQVVINSERAGRRPHRRRIPARRAAAAGSVPWHLDDAAARPRLRRSPPGIDRCNRRAAGRHHLCATGSRRSDPASATRLGLVFHDAA